MRPQRVADHKERELAPKSQTNLAVTCKRCCDISTLFLPRFLKNLLMTLCAINLIIVAQIPAFPVFAGSVPKSHFPEKEAEAERTEGCARGH